MKIVLPWLVLFLLACGSTAPGEQNNGEDKAQLLQKEELAAKLHGTYYSKEYFDLLASTKSPIMAYDSFQGEWFGFSLNKENLVGEKPVLQGWSLHEGAADLRLEYDANNQLFKATSKEKAKDAPEVSRQMQLNEKDSVLMLGGQSYIKVASEQMLARKILFEGEYKEKGGNAILRFSGDGKLEGIAGADKFEVQLDYGLDFEVDMIYLMNSKEPKNSRDPSEGKYYRHFQIKENQLYLYEVKGRAPEWKISKSAKVYNKVK